MGAGVGAGGRGGIGRGYEGLLGSGGFSAGGLSMAGGMPLEFPEHLAPSFAAAGSSSSAASGGNLNDSGGAAGYGAELLERRMAEEMAQIEALTAPLSASAAPAPNAELERLLSQYQLPPRQAPAVAPAVELDPAGEFREQIEAVKRTAAEVPNPRAACRLLLAALPISSLLSPPPSCAALPVLSLTGDAVLPGCRRVRRLRLPAAADPSGFVGALRAAPAPEPLPGTRPAAAELGPAARRGRCQHGWPTGCARV